jgi:hypothetical protein
LGCVLCFSDLNLEINRVEVGEIVTIAENFSAQINWKIEN